MKDVIAKIPIQDTRLFYKKWDNFENLNNLLKTEIEAEREKDPKGLPATNTGCWRSMMKYKCEAELMKPIGMILSAYMDHYFPRKPMDASIYFIHTTAQMQIYLVYIMYKDLTQVLLDLLHMNKCIK